MKVAAGDDKSQSTGAVYVDGIGNTILLYLMAIKMIFILNNHMSNAKSTTTTISLCQLTFIRNPNELAGWGMEFIKDISIIKGKYSKSVGSPE